MNISHTPEPPYYAVIFTSVLTIQDEDYHEVADQMLELASKQPGFLGVESVRNELGITVSYWENLEAIRLWKANVDHVDAQIKGKKKWYAKYKVRIAKVERDYSFEKI